MNICVAVIIIESALSELTWAAPIRNVILCIGDGMGPEQIKAASYYAGTNLFFESFPYQSIMTTFPANSTITDSAASATAMATGTKVNNGVLSLQLPGNGQELENLVEYFKIRGKATGLVVTSYITHATPAAFGAHETSRFNYTSIANDYLNQTKPNILFGGGANGISIGSAVASGYTVVVNKNELLSLNSENEKFVSGQFGNTHLPYETDGLGVLPHLHEMTQAALNILDNNPNGFFLMVEGSRIDHAGHENNLVRNIHETLEFSESVKTVFNWMGDRQDTLLLVTADHETGGLTVLNDNGAGNYPDVTWSTTYHTETLIPVYGIGQNAFLVTNVTDNTDIYSVITSSTTGPEVCIATHTNTNGFQMTWTSFSNAVYQVEYSSDLTTSNWVPLTTVTATASQILITDTNTFSHSRFYRMIQLEDSGM